VAFLNGLIAVLRRKFLRIGTVNSLN